LATLGDDDSDGVGGVDGGAAASSGGIARGGKHRSSGAYGFATEATRVPQISRGGKQRSSGAYGFSGGGGGGDDGGIGGDGSAV
jgi:hypothetical protein